MCCAACCQDILEDEYYSCISCQNRLHKLCVYDSLKPESSDNQNLTCICPECKCKRPRVDNTNTPVRATPHLDRMNVTYRRERPTVLDASVEFGEAFDVTILLTEIRQLRIAVNDLTMQNSEIALLRKEVTELKTQLALMPTPQSCVGNCEKQLEARDREITELRSTVAELQHIAAAQEQNGIRNELEIVGIPETEHENLHQLVLVASAKLGVTLVDTDIDGLHRAGPRRSSTIPSASNPKNLPRPIVVKLTRRTKRDELVKASKERKTLTSQDIVPGTSTSVYMNERLTKLNRALFRLARERAAQHKFRYCWTRDGCIYVRKAEKMSAVRQFVQRGRRNGW